MENQQLHATAIQDLIKDMHGFAHTQIIGLFARLTLADLLAGGPQTPSQLASATQIPAPMLLRLLRAATTLQLIEQLEDGRYQSTTRGALLRASDPASLYGLVLLVTSPWNWSSWSKLEDALRFESATPDQSAFALANGMPIWQYFAQHSREVEVFHRAMQSFQSYNSTIATAYDFSHYETVVDIGGGDGTLLREILHQYPELHGVLIDRTDALEQARKASEGSTEARRIRMEPGDFLGQLPPIDTTSVVILKWILHNWNDDQANRILSTLHQAMTPGTTLILIESLDSEAPDPFGVIQDLQMLVFFGGKERSLPQYQALLHDHHFRFQRCIATSTPFNLIEAIAC